MDNSFNSKRIGLYIGFGIVAIGHFILIAANLVAPIFLILHAPWYVAAPLITVLFSPMAGASYCAYNQLENFFRSRLGLELIEHDVTIHYINLIRRMINGLRKV